MLPTASCWPLLDRITFGGLIHEGCSWILMSLHHGIPKQRSGNDQAPTCVSVLCSFLPGSHSGAPIRVYCLYSTVQASLPWGDSGLYIPSAGAKYRRNCVSTLQSMILGVRVFVLTWLSQLHARQSNVLIRVASEQVKSTLALRNLYATSFCHHPVQSLALRKIDFYLRKPKPSAQVSSPHHCE